MHFCPSILSSYYCRISTGHSKVLPLKERTYKWVTLINDFHIAVKNVTIHLSYKIEISINRRVLCEYEAINIFVSKNNYFLNTILNYDRLITNLYNIVLF